MENRGILTTPWKKLPMTFRAAVLFATLGAFLTALIVILTLSSVNAKGDSPLSLLFPLAMWLAGPTMDLCQIFGISQGHAWFGILEVLVNTVLFFLAGALLGWIVSRIKKTLK
jgi:NhaP-type Na+/H+ or K+/H+ antiporter